MKHILPNAAKLHVYLGTPGMLNIYSLNQIAVKDIIQVGLFKCKVTEVIKKKMSMADHYPNHFYYELRFIRK